jgi:tryptophanyl-tRNA synthetase
MKKTVLSGMRPTGRLHLGNYFGALENWIKLQDEYECNFFVADWHALTTGYNDTKNLTENTYDMLTDWISAGLDPERCTVFLQSALKEHAELHLLFSMVTPLSWLMRCPTYKDILAQTKDRDIATYGFLGYPCLQAADILMYNADFVPVGEDQLPHLELSREIARRFNYIYGEVFKEPQPLLTKAKVLIGTDGRKMSKSYDNTILLSDSPDNVKKQVMTMVTDPARIRKDDPGHPDICSVFAFHKVLDSEDGAVGAATDNGGVTAVINDNDAVAVAMATATVATTESAATVEIGENCKAGRIGCIQCKRLLADKLCEMVSPVYNKRCELLKKPEYVTEVLREGTRCAMPKAQKMMRTVREAMHLPGIEGL